MARTSGRCAGAAPLESSVIRSRARAETAGRSFFMGRSIVDFYDVWKKNCTVFPNLGEYGLIFQALKNNGENKL
jgi:hypothetical protein